MQNPFGTSAQYDDFVGRVAIDEYRDAGHSADLLRAAAKAVELPSGFEPVGLTFGGPPKDFDGTLRITVVAVSRDYIETSLRDAIEKGTELPCEQFDGSISLHTLLEQIKRLRVSVFPKAFENGNFTGLC